MKRCILSLSLIITIISMTSYQTIKRQAIERSADIIIYGGTSAAVTAAVQARRSGKSVIIVSPDIHLGGLSAGGLGFTDLGNKEVIGGLSREFYQRVYKHYENEKSWNWQKRAAFGNRGQGVGATDSAARAMWIFEPHVAEGIFEAFIKENNIQLFRDQWLDRASGVKMDKGRIVSIKTLDGSVFKGKVFIDATYEGDLMAAAKVSYHVGREANSKYNEKWNGVQEGVFHHFHHFTSDIDPYKIPGNPTSGLLPRISANPPGKNGEGDNKLQAYCYRMCLTNNPANRVPFSRPAGYDSLQYELLVRVFNAGWSELFKKFDKIPNLKTDVNNQGPFSTDNIGMNYDYPDASYERRKAIIKEHEIYQKGWLYFIATDARIPKQLQDTFNTWGLSADEFKDNGNWPHQLYVREARRMVGEHVVTEHDIIGDSVIEESVGMGSYTMDSHHTQRFVTSRGFVQNEGDIGVHPPKPYAISYYAIVPKERECTNLIVPVCVSSSHITYGSIRMEPVFMILGQSAAAAASLAIDEKVNVQQVPYQKLKALLIKQQQRLTFEPPAKGHQK
ncbi:MAG: FAD-dependent oxidoreductase [Chitinophagaceae bacterium]|nr:FAD-dependent oxidoreductase [Chitinophagaceae bacterium]